MAYVPHDREQNPPGDVLPRLLQSHRRPGKGEERRCTVTVISVLVRAVATVLVTRSCANPGYSYNSCHWLRWTVDEGCNCPYCQQRRADIERYYTVIALWKQLRRVSQCTVDLSSSQITATPSTPGQ